MEKPSAEKVLFLSDVAGPHVDVVHVANRFGINVFRVDNTPWLAALDIESENDKCIFVSSNLKWDEQRVLIAHELAHYFLHRDQKNAFRDYEIINSSNDQLEVEAENYAMDLLTFPPWLEAYARYLSINSLSLKFEVPALFLQKQILALNIPVK